MHRIDSRAKRPASARAGMPYRIRPMPGGAVAMQTGRAAACPARAWRVAPSRRPENEVTQTRSQVPVRRDHLGQRPDDRGVLHVDVEPHVGPGAEQVGQQRDRLGAADPGPGHLLPGQLGDPPGGVGHPVQGLVVERHHLAVGGGVRVGLQVGVAQLDRVLEREPGVLREVGGPAAVRERDRARMIKESRRHGTSMPGQSSRSGPVSGPASGVSRAPGPAHSRRRASASAMAAATATFSDPTLPACGM